MKHIIVFLAITALWADGFSQGKPKPIVMVNGQIVKDTTTLGNFDRIDYVQGRKGVELFGPKGAQGVIIIQADGKIPLYGEVTSSTGKRIKGAEIISADGKVLATTNDCGTFFLPCVAIGETVTVQKKGYIGQSWVTQQSEWKVKLKRKMK